MESSVGPTEALYEVSLRTDCVAEIAERLLCLPASVIVRTCVFRTETERINPTSHTTRLILPRQ